MKICYLQSKSLVLCSLVIIAFFGILVFCTTQTLDYPNNEDEIKVTFPDTQAGYQSSSIDKCPEDTSNGNCFLLLM